MSHKPKFVYYYYNYQDYVTQAMLPSLPNMHYK